MEPVEAYELSAEEFEQAKKNLINRVRDVPDWKSLLLSNTCHVKCCDLPRGLGVALWINLDDEELADLYAEARESNGTEQ